MLKNFSVLSHQRVPGQLVIQFTDRCNAKCPQCGMRVTEKFPRSKLSTDDVRRILDAAGQNNFKAVSFTGGEPLLYLDELVELIKHAGDAGIPYIRTGTNGFLFCGCEKKDFEKRIHAVAEKLADTPIRNLWISIDSAFPEVHEEMRGLSNVVRGIEKALPIFHEKGIFPSANLGINRNTGGEKTRFVGLKSKDPELKTCRRFFESYRSALVSFYRLVSGLGFTMVNTCYPMSIPDNPHPDHLSPVYSATSDEEIVRYNALEKRILFKALSAAISEFRSKIRIFTPQSSLYALIMQMAEAPLRPYACRGGADFFFIDARDGNTYPCGYRGNENLGKFWEINWHSFTANNGCRRCDWECFRDPSELFGPLLHLLANPIGLIKKAKNDPKYFRFWLTDLNYYRACDLFDGRKPPDYHRLANFTSTLHC